MSQYSWALTFNGKHQRFKKEILCFHFHKGDDMKCFFCKYCFSTNPNIPKCSSIKYLFNNNIKRSLYALFRNP